MKHFKRITSALLAVVCMCAFGTASVFAQDVKVGGGSGTIEVTQTTQGETYELYKLFDATVSPTDNTKITYTTTKAITGAGLTWFTVKDIGGGKWEVSGIAPALTAGVKTDEFKTWALGYGTKLSTATADASGSVKFTELPYGYYVINSSVDGGKYISVTSANPNGTIIDKNNVPELKGKFIVVDKGLPTEREVKVASHGLDDAMTFRLKVNGVNYNGTKKIYEYTVTDTLDEGLSYKAGTLNVTIGGVKINAGSTGTGKRYTVTYYTDAAMATPTTDVTKARAFKVTIPWTTNGTINGDFLYKTNDEIKVEYDSIIDSTKGDKVVFGEKGNANTMKSSWKDADGSHELPESKTEQFITQLEVFKYTGNKQPLTGAEFTLERVDGGAVVGTKMITTGTRFVAATNGTYWKLKSGSYTTVAPTTAGVSPDAYASTTQKYNKVSTPIVQTSTTGTGATKISVYVGDDGIAKFSGLYDGTYKLVESVVPDGYNKAADIEFTIKFNEATKTYDITGTGITKKQSTGGAVLRVEVENKSGTVLPSTGGIGTTLFYACGGLLVVGAGVLLVTRKRMGAER